MDVDALERSKRQHSLLWFSLFCLIIDTHWVGGVFNHTVFSTTGLFYGSLFVTVAMFVSLLFRMHNASAQGLVMVWLPYVLITLLSFLVSFQFQRLSYWFIFLVILLASAKNNFIDDSPYKLIVFGSFFAAVGVYIQFFFFSFYNNYIKELFSYEAVLDITDLNEVLGLNGFTYQAGTTSLLIMFGLIIILYLKKRVLPDFFQNGFFYWLIVALLFIAIFLTGKRSVSLAAIVVPVLVYYFSRIKKSKRLTSVIIISVLFALFYSYLLPRLLESSDIFFFKRLSYTIESVQQGGTANDVSSGRQELWDLAIAAWKDHPLLGIGVGKFQEYTHSDMEAHNTYLQVLCEQGIVVFTIFCVAIIYCLLITIRLFNRIKGGYLQDYLKVALAFQLFYIIIAITGNVHLGLMPPIYFIGIALLNRIYFMNLKEHDTVITYPR